MKSVHFIVISIFSVLGIADSLGNRTLFTGSNIKEYLTAKPDTTPAQKIRLPQDKQDPISLKDPSSIEKEIQYDPETNRYIITERIGSDYINSSSMTFEEYVKYKNKQLEQQYFNQLAGTTSSNQTTGKDPVDKIDVKKTLIDRLFGGNTVEIKPQGNVDLTFGANYQNVRNPSLTIRQQRQTNFDFDMNIQMNLQGKIGEKLNLNTSYNSQATFDFDNVMKLNYNSDQFSEDEILKKIDAGDVSLPLRTSLIQGAQKLFGVKAETQFGHLRLTGIASQSRTQQQRINLQGGALVQDFEIQGDEYDENQHYFLGHYFRNTFEGAMVRLPYISTLAKIDLTSLQVWISPDPRDINNLRQVVAFSDLGEYDRMNNPNADFWRMGVTPVIDMTTNQKLPTNGTNRIYQQFIADPNLRQTDKVVSGLQRPPFNFTIGRDFEVFKGKLLDPRDFTVHPDLGFISFRRTVRPSDIVAISYKYTFNGKAYKVGEFTQEVAPDSLNVIVTKLVKPRSNRVDIPIWDLMMKNFYSLRSFGISEEDFKLDILFDDPGAGEKRFLPETELKSIPLLNLLNLDKLNKQRDPFPDGVFDFVPGLTIDPQNGKMMFPVLEPFGQSLGRKISDPDLRKKYVFQQLYDSTKTQSLNFPEANRYIIRGEYKSANGGDVALNSFNIPQGSVRVKAGAQELSPSQYEIDYQTGRVRVTDPAILSSGVPVTIDYEDNSLFGFNNNRTMFGLRGEYEFNKHLSLGGTVMRLFERPYTQKVNIGEDPINNAIYGLDLVYNNEAPWITRLLDRLPLLSTKEPSKISFLGEAAALRPGHSKAINQGKDKGGTAYIDDFEGSTSSQDLGTQINLWFPASTPSSKRFREGGPDNSNTTFPFVNRAKLSWYRVDRRVRNGNEDAYSVGINITELFPNRNIGPGLNNELYTFNMHFNPAERGPYNFDVPGGTPYSAGLDQNGKLRSPTSRWGGIQRGLYNTDFEAANIETIEFWVLNPFMPKSDGSPITRGGNLYINLGDITEDIMRDGQLYFENGLPTTQNKTRVDTTAWGRVPLVQSITRAHNNDPEILKQQDLGFDGLDDDGERQYFADYLQKVQSLNPLVFERIREDPSNDNYKYFNDESFAPTDDIYTRYKDWNNPQGNSSFTELTGTEAKNYTQYPESEDINDDNAFDQSEAYYEYRVPMFPDNAGGMAINKYITDTISGPGGRIWYRVKIPLESPDTTVGSISGLRNIRFIRMFMADFDQSVTLRMNAIDMVRNQWRRYRLPLCASDDIDDNFKFDINDVNIEENSQRFPIPYVVPAGIQRENSIGPFPYLLQNEQSIALTVKDLKGGCASAVYKTIRMDMRNYESIRMFVHADSPENLSKQEFTTFVRIGSDFTNNYYEYQIPTILSKRELVIPGQESSEIWKVENELNLELQAFVNLKKERNLNNAPLDQEYKIPDPKNPDRMMVVVGNPTLGKIKQVMLGMRFPVRSAMEHAADVWFNELRLNGINEQGGYGAIGRLDIQLADLGDMSISGNLNSIGWGALDQKVLERRQEDLKQFDINSNLELGKFLPSKWGIKIPLYTQFSVNTSSPKFDPYDLDIKLKEKLVESRSSTERDSIRTQAQDYEAIRSINFTNVRKERTGDSKPAPWDISNFSFNYSFTQNTNHDPIVEEDQENVYKGGFNYVFARQAKYFTPFKKLTKNDKLIRFITQFNINPLPNSFSFSTGLDRRYGTRAFRFSTPEYGTSITKLFYWDRKYNLQWDLTQSLKFSFNASNNSAIDELAVMDSLGRVDPNYDEKRNKELIWENIRRLGRPKNYMHNYNASYNLPTRHIPLMDWIQVTAQGSGTFAWLAGSENVVDFLGNVIQNSQTRQLSANLNFDALYDKWSYLQKINQPAGQSTTTPRTRDRTAPQPGAPQPATREKKDRQPSWIERLLIRPLMSLRKGRLTYSENLASLVPGFKALPKYLGLANGFGDPGWAYVLGMDPTQTWLDEIGRRGMITEDIRLNQQFSRNYNQTLDARLTVEPFSEFNIEISLNKNYTRNYLEFFKNDGSGAGLKHLTPTEVGSFNISYLGINTLFGKNVDSLYAQFERNRAIFSERQPNKPGAGNHPNDLGYIEGFGRKNQNVIIPAFIATYTGLDPQNSGLDIFKTKPRPNWQLTYNGLHKLPFLNKVLSGASIRHGYNSKLMVNQYNTDVFYDPDSVYRTKALTSDYYSRIEIPNVVMTESFSPLIGIDFKTLNDLQFNFDYSVQRSLSLNMIDYQLIEQNSKELTIGFGWRIKNVVFPFGNGKPQRTRAPRPTDDQTPDARGRTNPAAKKGNDLNLKFDLSFRDDLTNNRVLDQDQNVPTRGAKTLRFSNAADYELNDRVTLRLFFDYNRIIPAVQESFPITTAKGGITVRLALK
ncbi:MAG: cell surface protein SprA [Saprospiraceae bacterium]|nr:cell surface protein SprA [Saprospiraceae bacterium]